MNSWVGFADIVGICWYLAWLEIKLYTDQPLLIILWLHCSRRCFTDPVKAWLKALTKNGVALHICLTHADLLYSECKAEGKLDSIAGELKVHT